MMEEILPVPAGARAAVRQTVHGCGSHAAPPNQCWPPCTECRCVDEILPVNIAGGARPVSATKLSMEPRHALPRHPAFYWQNFVHPQYSAGEDERLC